MSLTLVPVSLLFQKEKIELQKNKVKKHTTRGGKLVGKNIKTYFLWCFIP